jgi:hypothetical protein
MPKQRSFIFSACLLLMMGARWGIAEDPPPANRSQAKSLDAQLWDDLDADLLKGLPAAGEPANDPSADSKPAGEAEIPSDVTDPLAVIGERMRAAQRRMANRDTSESTQQLQRQIQADLAALIEQARQQGDKQKSGSGPGSQAGNTGGNPTPAPPRDSTDRVERGTKEVVETADVKNTISRFWGHLPDKLREQLQSSLSEQFLPKYERLIEDYYRALAEDRNQSP